MGSCERELGWLPVSCYQQQHKVYWITIAYSIEVKPDSEQALAAIAAMTPDEFTLFDLTPHIGRCDLDSD